MALTSGTRLGPYEIVAKLGEGGMGEVYRATDSNLKRSVAIKVLPASMAADADRLARFQREAEVLAALNHPNIAGIYGLEKTPDLTALVMELVEGRDLSEIIGSSEAGSSDPASSPGLKTRPPSGIPLADALPIAKQIADALEAAHEQGIIHRDLKPANIKVRADGTVKVLDFGLAKATDSGTPGPQDSDKSPTMTARATQMGMILGTAAYMSPEQARGKAVDKRADIWAFGVVLYEMLTGRRAFEGEDISVTLANVIKETPTWDALPADLPAPIRRLLRRCLEKDPKRRLGAISDARLELDEASSSSDVAPVAAPRSDVARWERAIWATLAGLATVAAVLFALRAPANRETTPPMMRFGVVPPREGRFVGTAPRFAISPDGKSLVFSATPQPNKPEQLWVRQLDSLELTPIPGTESTPGAAAPQSPFWSPDSRHLAFFVQSSLQTGTQGSRLQRVDLTGGAVQTICELPSNNASGSWNAEGVMLVSSQETNGIQRVSATGGALAPVTTLDASTNEVAHLWPQFLPDGRHFIYQVQTEARSGWAIFVGSIDSADRHKVVQSDYARFAAPNLLLYIKSENLLAQTMDLKTYQLTGEPVVVGTGIPSLSSNGRAGFAVSDAGVLVYSSNPDQQVGAADRRLTWVDRSGKPLGSVGPPISAFAIRLSPDGQRVALLEQMPDRAAGRQLWVTDLGRNVKAPLTSRHAYSSVWSDDGARLLFGSNDGTRDIVIAERLASGATPMTTLYKQAGQDPVPLDESSDGRLVVLSLSNGGPRGLYVLSKSDGKVVPYLADGFDHPHASLSRDGRWLAYTSNESGVYEVVVQPFPDPSRGKWLISTNGGLFPRWRRDGRELFYMNADQQVVAVPVTANPNFVPGTALPLLTLLVNPGPTSTGAYVYDVSPDGQRILMSLPPGGLANTSAAIPLTVTANWTSLLKKK